jgi:hypothetical protein
MTFAYVFWHWPAPGVAPDDYERALAGFCAALWQQPPLGLLATSTAHVTNCPWAPTMGAYEDWHVVDSLAVLERLNDFVVSPTIDSAHNQIAGLAAGGTAGIYRFRSAGRLNIDAPLSRWFGKPAGMRYQEFLAVRTSQLGADALWQRQLTLGPAPEFCVLGASTSTLVGSSMARRIIGTWS